MAEERYSRFQKLIDAGKEKGYLLYDDVSEVLPEDASAGPELDDLLADRIPVHGRSAHELEPLMLRSSTS